MNDYGQASNAKAAPSFGSGSQSGASNRIEGSNEGTLGRDLNELDQRACEVEGQVEELMKRLMPMMLIGPETSDKRGTVEEVVARSDVQRTVRNTAERLERTLHALAVIRRALVL